MIDDIPIKEPKFIKVLSRSYLFGLITKCGLFFTCGLILTALLLYFSAQSPLGPSYLESFTRLTQLKSEMLLKSILSYFLMMLLVLAGVIWITVQYSHRVVGPLSGMRRTIRRVAGGDLTAKVTIREKDAIAPLADEFNLMIDSHRKRLAQIQRKTLEMNRLCSETAASVDDKEFALLTKEIAALLQDIKL